ncbi:hypothetical protein PoB_004241900 [Plakobranchus ocellatus]|uniref:Uncharacterized protein n=1 Tax=Plakobranchus ocellatus TaxID=259542 RepID=A0AAV4BC26_9GAST|nr:hypothetical protein PoB_004241900 [Plakobranchus ocellatus]
MTRGKSEPNPPGVGNAVKAGISTPAPRTSSFPMSQTHSAGAIVHGTARGSAVSSDTSTNGKSSKGGGGYISGGANGQRGGLLRRPSSCSGDGRSSKSDLADDGGRASSGGHRGSHRGKRVASSCAEKSSKVDKLHDASPREQEEDDDEEDETGMPQAVRLPESTTDEVETYQDIVKRLHGAQMETIAKNVKPKHLLRHLAEDGYFRYDYSDHTRTNTDNHNLKYGMKKGVERLYLWLAMYSPPEENTQT